jgi:hypothetical protein
LIIVVRAADVPLQEIESSHPVLQTHGLEGLAAPQEARIRATSS